MTDIVNKKRRSEIMKAVKSRDTSPEILVRRFLFHEGFRFRLNDITLPGKPDIKLTKHNCLVFVNGCFWHGHKNCSIYVMPKTNSKFWDDKINKNVKRDSRNIRILKKMGWRVLVVWECDLKGRKAQKTLKKLKKDILN